MGINSKAVVLSIVIILSGCTAESDKSICANMEGQYQRIDSPLALKDSRNISVYLKRIDGTNNGFYGIVDYTDFKYSLQPMVRENPQCSIVFERETLSYTKDRDKYGCNYVFFENANRLKFYCLQKDSDKIPESINKAFDKVKNEPLFNDMSEVDSVMKWNDAL